MLANNWYDQSIQFEAIDGRRTSLRQDNDEALDDWLASLSVNQFARVLDFLLGTTENRRLDRSA
ncbi:MAG: hypothetical protein IT306_18030 [Chloroflexi bacterium]|nr:hypothetical protein [Chloroflexota bacterium]